MKDTPQRWRTGKDKAMTTTIHLDPTMVPATLRGEYSGRQFRAQVSTQGYVPADAGLWSGGSCSHYTLIELSTGRAVAFPGQQSAPWDAGRKSLEFDLPRGFVVREHVVFCGKDLGLRFTVHPEDAAPLLPKPVDLSHVERLVLMATVGFKSSYGGQDRYQMAQNAYAPCWKAPDPNKPAFPTRQAWDAAKADLATRGLLDKRGAITVAGRNAIGSERI